MTAVATPGKGFGLNLLLPPPGRHVCMLPTPRGCAPAVARPSSPVPCAAALAPPLPPPPFGCHLVPPTKARTFGAGTRRPPVPLLPAAHQLPGQPASRESRRPDLVAFAAAAEAGSARLVPPAGGKLSPRPAPKRFAKLPAGESGCMRPTFLSTHGSVRRARWAQEGEQRALSETKAN